MLDLRHSRDALARRGGLYRTRPRNVPHDDHAVARAPPATGLQGRPVVPALATADAIRRFRDPTHLNGSGRVQPLPLRAAEVVDDGANDAHVHALLHELVDISQSIAAYLTETTPRRATASASSARQGVALDAQAIERIVRRVEAHFVTKIKALETEKEELQEQLRRACAGGREGAVAAGETDVDAARFDERQRSREVDQLRAALAEEKRQRLRVEEQIEQLVEQHAKLVASLERRVRKQEEQLRGPPSSTKETAQLASAPAVWHNEHSQDAHLDRLTIGPASLATGLHNQKRDQTRHESQARLSSSPESNTETLERYRPMATQVPASFDDVATVEPSTAHPATIMSSSLATDNAGNTATHAIDQPPSVPMGRAVVDEIDSFLDTITQELQSLQR